MAVLLGLVVAATYGAADFLGGLTSKRAEAVAVVVGSQATSLVLLAGLLALDRGSAPTGRDLVLGAMAGAAASVGLLLLYRGLAVGRMSVVAPITAVGTAVLPVGYGLATGDRPSAISLAGVALALPAVALVAAAPDGGGVTVDRRRIEVGLAMGSGVAFGLVFIVLGETGEDAGLWPLLPSRICLIGLVVAGALLTGRSLRVPTPVVRLVALAGALDLAANACYLLAVRRGLLSLVAVLGSLYPASTVLLARLVLGERLGHTQVGGIVLAVAGVVLIAAG